MFAARLGARRGCRSASSWSWRLWCLLRSGLTHACWSGSLQAALWIAALTAALLPIERLIEPDRANGTLDQLTLHNVSEEAVGAAKVAAHWLTFGPLLLLAALPSAFILGIAADATRRTLAALAIGTPGLAALAVMVAALTAGLPRAGALAGVLLLPLAIPLLIFGAGAAGDPESGGLLLEAAVSFFLSLLRPSSWALRSARPGLRSGTSGRKSQSEAAGPAPLRAPTSRRFPPFRRGPQTSASPVRRSPAPTCAPHRR